MFNSVDSAGVVDNRTRNGCTYLPGHYTFVSKHAAIHRNGFCRALIGVFPTGCDINLINTARGFIDQMAEVSHGDRPPGNRTRVGYQGFGGCRDISRTAI